MSHDFSQGAGATRTLFHIILSKAWAPWKTNTYVHTFLSKALAPWENRFPHNFIQGAGAMGSTYFHITLSKARAPWEKYFHIISSKAQAPLTATSL